jgi:heat shock protein HtpX
MSTLYTEQSKNITKTWLLIGVFLAICIGFGYFLADYYQNPGILTIALIFSIVMNIAGFWFSDKIAIATARAVPADGPEYLELNRIVENLSITAGLPKPKVYIIPDNAPNAFANALNAASL